MNRQEAIEIECADHAIAVGILCDQMFMAACTRVGFEYTFGEDGSPLLALALASMEVTCENGLGFLN